MKTDPIHPGEVLREETVLTETQRKQSPKQAANLPTSDLLTPSELESLRQDMDQASKFYHANKRKV